MPDTLFGCGGAEVRVEEFPSLRAYLQYTRENTVKKMTVICKKKVNA